MSFSLAAALTTGTLIVLPATPAAAVTENGYVHNNAWTVNGEPGSLSGPDTNPNDAERTAASISSSFPTGIGDIAVTAEFTPGADKPPGLGYFTVDTPTSTHSPEGPVSGNLAGKPTLSELPTFEVRTSGSGCGLGSTAAVHQNFAGVCENTGSITLRFSQPVTNPVLDVTGLGGMGRAHVAANKPGFRYARGGFAHTRITLATPGVTFGQPAPGSTNMAVTETTIDAAADNTNPYCDNRGVGNVTNPKTKNPKTVAASCGSVTLNGTFSEVTLDFDTEVYPFSQFPDAGTSFYANLGDGYADGINGANFTRTEPMHLPPDVRPRTPGTIMDRFHVSLRLPVGALGDRVFLDGDGDGIQGVGEVGVPGVTATLVDGEGNAFPGVDAVVTDASGNYLFSDLPEGDYAVVFSGLPPGGKFSPQNAVGTEATDSDADATGRTDTVTLSAAAANNLDLDAGVVIVGTIGDLVFNDLNGNGAQDSAEPGVPGVTVTLLDADGNPVTGIDPVVTGDDGAYAFTDLPFGTYSVEFSGLPAGFVFTTANQGDEATDSDADTITGRTAPVVLTQANPINLDVDAGLQQFGALGDLVFDDVNRNGVQDSGEPGMAGVTVALLDGAGAAVDGIDPIVTGASGAYLFDELPLGDYRVQFTAPAGSTFSPADAGGDDALDSDATPSSTNAAVGLSPVISLTAASPDNLTVDAGIIDTLGSLGSIGDFVWNDANGNGIQDRGEAGVSGVSITLLDSTGNPVPGVDPVTTDANGRYLFTNLAMGDYTVEVTLPRGRTLAPMDAGLDATDSDIDVTTGRSPLISLTPANPDNTTVDAGLLPSGSIGNRAWHDVNRNGQADPGEPGVAGVTVILLDRDENPIPDIDPITTGTDGHYRFTDLPLGQYRLKFTPPAGLIVTTFNVGSGTANPGVDPDTGISGIITLTLDNPDFTHLDAGLVSPPGSNGAPNSPALPSTGISGGLISGLAISLAALLAGLVLLLLTRKKGLWI